MLSYIAVANKYVKGKVTEEEMKSVEKEVTDLLCESDTLKNPFTIVMLYFCVDFVCKASASDIGRLFSLVEEIKKREDLRNTLKMIEAMKNPFTKEG